MARIKGLFLFVIFVLSVVKKRDEIFGENEARAYYDRLEKAHSAPHEIRMQE